MKDLDRAPIFKLYGGQDDWPTAEMVHCETIASRSRLHHWHIRPHRHSGLYQILHLQQGRAVVSLDEARHVVTGPAVVEIPQAFVHGFEFDENSAGHVVTLAYPMLTRLVHRLDPDAILPGQPAIHTMDPQRADPGLHEACTQLNALYQSSQPFRGVQIEAWLTLLYARIRSSCALGGQQTPRARGLEHYTRFGRLLESAYAAHHDVAWYARRLGLSAAHLNVVTRTHANKTPLQLIHARLALEAGRSLVYTSMTISEISDDLGFAEPAHFTRFFRRTVGEAPRTFRQRAWDAGRLTLHDGPPADDPVGGA